MSDAKVIEIAGGALIVAAKILGPMLGVTLVIGTGVALIQTITQVQESTLTFVPKLIAAAALLFTGGAWMIHTIVTWVHQLWGQIPQIK